MPSVLKFFLHSICNLINFLSIGKQYRGPRCIMFALSTPLHEEEAFDSVLGVQTLDSLLKSGEIPLAKRTVHKKMKFSRWIPHSLGIFKI